MLHNHGHSPGVLMRGLSLLAMLVLAAALMPAGVFAQSLALDDCVRLAVEKNHALEAQRFDLAAKESLAAGARGLAGPQVSLFTGYQWLSEPTAIIPAHGLTTLIPAVNDTSQTYWGINFSQNLYDAGKTGAWIKFNDDAAALQHYTLDAQDLTTTGSVVKYFYRILQLDDNIKAQEDVVAALTALADDTRAKLKVGRIAEVDSLQVEAQLEAEKERLLRLQSDRTRQVSLLKSAIGFEQQQDLVLRGRLEDYDASMPMTGDLLQNPDVKRAAAVKAQSADILKSFRADSAIHLTLNGQYTARILGHFHPTQANYDDMWTITIQANLPIFDGGIIAANVKQAKLSAQKSAELYAQAKSDAEANAYAARAAAEDAAARVEAGKVALDRAQEAYRIMKLSYNAGKASTTDLLFAQSALTNAQSAYYQAVYDRISAIVDLKLVYGQNAYQAKAIETTAKEKAKQ